MSQSKTKRVRRKKSKGFYRIKEILLEQGKDEKWFAENLKSRFKVNKKTTYAILKDELIADIMLNVKMAIVLRVKLEEIYNY